MRAAANRVRLQADQEGACPAEDAPRRPAASDEDTMSRRILIVEDEENIVLSLQFLLKQAGYIVDVAPDGAAAMRLMSRRPDLVVLDVMLPDRDGYSICEEIRAHKDWRETCILMLTARGRDFEREKGLALGADDYVTKPFSTRDLMKRIDELLASSPDVVN
jgi:DNA-binding response OmpR family regulator